MIEPMKEVPGKSITQQEQQVSHKGEVTKFTEEELTQIKKLQESYQQKVLQFGDLKFARMEMKKQWDTLNDQEVKLENEYLQLQESEKQLTENLQQKYGDGVLNLETGEFSKQ